MGSLLDPHPKEAEHPHPQPESHLDEVASVFSELRVPSAS